MKTKIFPLLALLAVLVFTPLRVQSSNVVGYCTRIDALGYANLINTKFIMEPLGDEIDPSSLEWKEYKRIASAYFIFRRAIPVETYKEADIVIRMRYWHQDEDAIGQRPIYGNAGVTRATTRQDAFGRVITDYENRSEVVGYHDYSYTKEHNYIEFFIHENKTKKHELIWKATLDMYQGSIRSAFPIMMYLSRWWLGKKTNGVQEPNANSYQYGNSYTSWVDNTNYNYIHRYVMQGREKQLHCLYWDSDFGQYGTGIAAKYLIECSAILQENNRTTIVFESNNWNVVGNLKLSDNMYIECNGQRYYAISADGITFNKKAKLSDPVQTFFAISFEKIPDDATSLIIREATKNGKIKAEWRVCTTTRTGKDKE